MSTMKNRLVGMAALAALGEGFMDSVGTPTKSKNKKTILFHKRGFEPIAPSFRHPARVLFACGWRTEAQIEKAQLRKRERGIVITNTTATVQPRKKKVYSKNPITKLFQFINGRYIKQS